MEQDNKTVVTRAEKKDATKQMIRKLLSKKSYKSTELIEAAFQSYVERFGGEDAPNDVKGRVGSVIDVMKKDGEITSKAGRYALKTVENEPTPTQNATEEQPKTAKKSKKKVVEKQAQTDEVKDEKPKKTRAKKTKKTEQPAEEKPTEEPQQPLPVPPLTPIAPTVPVTPEIAPEPVPEKQKRTRKAKAKKEEKTQEIAIVEQPKTEEVQAVVIEEIVEEPPMVSVEEKKTEQPVLMDMSFLFGEVKPKKEEPKRLAPAVERKQLPPVAESRVEKEEKPVQAEKKEQKPVEKKPEQKPVEKKTEQKSVPVRRTPTKTQTADEKLCEAFLKRIRRLGGEYFEYYSVYLIEKYSRMSGRRLEGLKICGGEHDGGIDGEIELTDRLGFRETIYIQSKNWNPDKGDERLWVVGETLLQQFIGACVCRQARDRKQHARGIFITTSRFTPEAKKVLREMEDKIVGYDGEELFETAKECGFGIIKKNGEYVLDEELLSGEKAFFFM